MLKLYSIFLLIVVLVLGIVVFYDNDNCSELEMSHGYGCCKDFNSNAVCDKDEVFYSSTVRKEKTTFFIDEQSNLDELRELQQKAQRQNLYLWQVNKTLSEEEE